MKFDHCSGVKESLVRVLFFKSVQSRSRRSVGLKQPTPFLLFNFSCDRFTTTTTKDRVNETEDDGYMLPVFRFCLREL